MKLLIVVGTRPNFVKVTQFKSVAKQFPSIEVKIVHTGQHNDPNMSEVFFNQFGLAPDFRLNISKGSPISQMAAIMSGLENVIQHYHPDLIMVVGDVNSTLAAALCANKCGIKLAHLESGLRSDDFGMPEEINRILTDRITDYFFITEESGRQNLMKEGMSNNLFMVGNTMIDTMVAFESEIDQAGSSLNIGLEANQKFCLMTIHRPSNVDSAEGLNRLKKLIQLVSQRCAIVFPVHPRTLKNLESFGLLNQMKQNNKLLFCEPLDYFAFQFLIKKASLVLTDSGGVQEETTFRKIPCITLRENTERPVTVKIGTNTLCDFTEEKIVPIIDQIFSQTYKKGEIPPLWDGKSTERVLKIIDQLK